MSGFLDAPVIESGGYQIQRSLRFRASASAYLSRTPGASNRKTWTWSGWVKRGALQDAWLLGADDGTLYSQIQLAGDYLRVSHVPNTGGTVYGWRTPAVLRDPSAWYHVVFSVDTTQATAANRNRIYVNGVEQTGLVDTTGYGAIPQNTDMFINAAVSHMQGRFIRGANNQFDGYLSEVNFIDGQALTPASFGQTDAATGQWVAKKYTGAYGTNGFYLDFSDPASTTTLCLDRSGNGNNWTPNNISVTAGVTYDSMLDVPAGNAGAPERGNYCVINAVDIALAGGLLREGNLYLNNAVDGAEAVGRGTIAVSSGKFYFEPQAASNGGYGQIFAGVQPISPLGSIIGYFVGTGGTYVGYGTYGVAVDLDAGKYWIRTTAGAWVSGDPAAGTLPSLTFTPGTLVAPAIRAGRTSGFSQAGYGWWNFGQRPFAYTPPAGFKALHTGNLPVPTIADGRKHFDVQLFSGNGASQTISGMQFAPDFIWGKSRSAASSHRLIDRLRGVGQVLYTDSTAAEGTEATALTSFNSNGYTMGGGSLNPSGVSMVDWLWKAGGAAVTNTTGSISSQVSANTQAGFSIVTWTGIAGGIGHTTGHGLGATLKFIIVKGRDAGITGTDHWAVYHAITGGGQYILLSSINAAAAGASYWNNSNPTSTVFSVAGNSANVSNELGKRYVAYCFAEIPGYSRFGSIAMNASADGTYLDLGFSAGLLILKRTDSTSNWIVVDTVRQTYNVMGPELYPNLSNAESIVTELDFTAGGVKFRNAGLTGTWIYAAWARTPFKYANAR